MKSELVRLRKLRKLAASTNFPHEAGIAQRMAAQIERRLKMAPGAPIEDEEGYDAETMADVTAWQQYVHAIPQQAGPSKWVLFEGVHWGTAPLDKRLA